jgi:thiol-disulfide isomerase/thioredoxin
MTRRRLVARWLSAGVLIVLAGGRPASADAPALASLLKPLDLVAYRAGTRPPSFTARTLAAGSLSMTDLRGKVVVVNFWASWCLECRPEMPVLERLHRELAPRGVAVIGINARENRDVIGRYAKELGLTFPLVLDPGGRINARYGVIGLPTTFLVGRDGRAVAFAVGPRAWTGRPARELIDTLLAEPLPGSP